ncbi:hypothetical protein [Pseudomonas sp. dw_358]|uniref:PA0061/PA0062 family lipoprotein n=1 Tax=Pseudomonas sp. dw_358 TaxID=2720083 RepID=UPI001BD3E9E5|nr:hypothetical protein [Pseudomonas sp. dw_358]
MKSKSLLLIPMFAAIGLLSACAGPMPKPNPKDAWIGIRDDSQNVVVAEKVDGKNTADGRFFEVKPGTHKLQVMVYDERTNDDTQTCSADLSYSDFKAGEHYRVVESDLGFRLSANLMDAHGNVLAHTGPLHCTAG